MEGGKKLNRQIHAKDEYNFVPKPARDEYKFSGRITSLCANCKKVIREQEGTNDGISHGLCAECLEKKQNEMRERFKNNPWR